MELNSGTIRIPLLLNRPDLFNNTLEMNELLVEELMEFLESAIHSILYIRRIYPPSLFEKRTYQAVSVWQARHPEINAYIRRVLDNMKPMLEQVEL